MQATRYIREGHKGHTIINSQDIKDTKYLVNRTQEIGHSNKGHAVLSSQDTKNTQYSVYRTQEIGHTVLIWLCIKVWILENH
jgi:hypothetical protein